MSENLNRKKELVEEIKEKINNSTSIVFVDYKGLTVSAADELRVKFKENNSEYKVYKNRIMLRALNDLGFTGVDDHFNGTTSVAFGYDSEVLPANLLEKAAKETKTMQVKFGILNGKVVDREYVKKLASIPSYDGLISQLLSVLNGPITSLALTLKAYTEK